MINSVVLVGVIVSDIFFDKKENKNSNLKFITFNLNLEKNFIFSKANSKKEWVCIKTYDFFFKMFKEIEYKNRFLALKGRIMLENSKIIIFADKISLLGKKS